MQIDAPINKGNSGGPPFDVDGNVGDVRTALSEAKAQGKHDALMRVKMGDAARLVAAPIGHA